MNKLNKIIFGTLLFFAFSAVVFSASTGYILNTDTGIISHGDVIRENIVPGQTTGKPPTNPMDDGIVGTFSVALADDTTEENRYLEWHVPQNWKVGTDVDIHLHYINVDAQTGTNNVIFGIEYAAVGHGEDATPTTTIVEITETLANNQAAEIMEETAPLTIDGANLDTDDAVGIRLYRKAGADTATGDIGLDGIHFEYTSDKL